MEDEKAEVATSEELVPAVAPRRVRKNDSVRSKPALLSLQIFDLRLRGGHR